MFLRITKMLFRAEDGHPRWRRWVGLLIVAALALLSWPTGAPADGTRAAPTHSGDEPLDPAATAAPTHLPLGDPWEATVVEPELEAPGPGAPWEAADSEPDGMPLPAAPVRAAGAAPGEKARGEPTAKTPKASAPELVPPEREYLRKTLIRYAQENGLPADLVMALAWKESSWRVRVVSDAGAIGVMQLMPDTIEFTSRKLMGLRRSLDPRDAVSNIRMGTRFLRHLVDRSGANYRKALIAYNQGITSFKAHGSYGESEDFAEAVLALRSRFRRS